MRQSISSLGKNYHWLIEHVQGTRLGDMRHNAYSQGVYNLDWEVERITQCSKLIFRKRASPVDRGLSQSP